MTGIKALWFYSWRENCNGISRHRGVKQMYKKNPPSIFERNDKIGKLEPQICKNLIWTF